MDYMILQNENNLNLMMYHLSPSFIDSIIEDNISYRYGSFRPLLPNLVGSIEYTLKIKKEQDTVNQDRYEIYLNIINKLCKEFNLSFNNTMDGEADLYTISYYLYEFLITNFREYMNRFIINIILKEKNNLYNEISVLPNIRDKDALALYGKMMYKDTMLGLLISNIEEVLNRIFCIDFNFIDLLNTAFSHNLSIRDYIIRFVSDNGNFFKDFYVETINKNIYGAITELKLSLYQIATA